MAENAESVKTVTPPPPSKITDKSKLDPGKERVKDRLWQQSAQSPPRQQAARIKETQTV